MPVRPRGLFVIDANVLIDYLQVDPAMLTLMATHLGPIHVPRRVIDEIIFPPMEIIDYENLGLLVVIEELVEIEAAVTLEIKGLSVPDKIVMVMSKMRLWIPITNDTRLRGAIAASGGLPPKWGLELMLELIDGGHLTAAAAIVTARRIVEANPQMRLNDDLIKRFERNAKKRR